jgi:hypothetical protein
VLLPRSSTVEVAAPPSAVGLGPELAFQLHQAPDPGAVGAEVGLEVGGRRTDGGQVDAEQFRAALQRRRDRPAQVWVVPSPPKQAIELLFEIPSAMLPTATGRIVGAHWGHRAPVCTGQQRTIR